jgi:hypothetical protein
MLPIYLSNYENPAALIKEEYKYNHLEGKNLGGWLKRVFVIFTQNSLKC